MLETKRQQRGLQLGATGDIVRKGDAWIVPSRSGKSKYKVRLEAEPPSCTCHSANKRGKCKHMLAAEQAKLEAHSSNDGATAEVVSGAQKEPRKTYSQDWVAYNAAQTHEKEEFLALLYDLCSGVCEPLMPKKGRPKLPLPDAIFAMNYKVYSTVSARRFMSDLREAETKGYITKIPHFNSILNYLENPEITPILQELIRQTSLPFTAIETVFAVDSSGFSSSRFSRWYDRKYGDIREKHEWVKIHIMCGVKTNIVTAVEIRDKDTSDTKLLPDLVNATAVNFEVREVLGDKAYGSLRNYDVIASHGAVPFIPFKSTHTGKGGGLWKKMFHLYHFHSDEYLTHYHQRSNIETTFSMMKRKFGDDVRSKTEVAMKNEVLCKILCHNICCLIHESRELGISMTFCADSTPAQKSPNNSTSAQKPTVN